MGGFSPGRFTAALLACGMAMLATAARAQEALTRPAWIERPNYVLVYPKRFDASEVSNMLIELPNRPLRAGETRPRGPAMMFPARRQSATPGEAQGPDPLRLTPFGPVNSGLQRPPQTSASRTAQPSRRRPLGW